MQQWAFDIIEQAQGWTTVDQVRGTLRQVCDDLQFNHYAYVLTVPKSVSQNEVCVLADYPAEWLQRYREQGYLEIDPVINHCQDSNLPYNWNELARVDIADVRLFVAEAKEFGLRHGVSLGIKGVKSDTGMMHLACDKQRPLSEAHFCDAALRLHAVLPYLHDRAAPLLLREKASVTSLTPREQQILLWVAEGKSSGEIALILDISEPTVAFHVKNAVQKLNASSRTHAVAKAMLMKIIVPRNERGNFQPYQF